MRAGDEREREEQLRELLWLLDRMTLPQRQLLIEYGRQLLARQRVEQRWHPHEDRAVVKQTTG